MVGIEHESENRVAFQTDERTSYRQRSEAVALPLVLANRGDFKSRLLSESECDGGECQEWHLS